MTVALIDAALRASILLAPALLWARFSRRSSAAARHAACFVTVLFAAAMPLLTGLLPDIEIAVLPAVIARAGGAVVPVAGGGWAVLVVGAWLLGALAFGARVLGGVARARTLCRWAKPVTDARVLSAAIRARRELGLEAPIRVLAQRRLAAPLSWGVIRPVILLPRGAKQWSRGRLRAVLLHELSHIRRRDCLTQLVADLACAVYWFHPLVWLAALRMRVERERACDDSVVVVGGRPSGYAVLLLRMVKGIPAGTHTARLSPATTFAASSFADGGELTGRLRALLGRARDRGSLTPAATLAFVLGALTLALPVAAVRLTAQAAAEPAASPATAPVAALVTDGPPPPAG
ncbi:MAG: M56 family metallopeptidase, partial [Planctomycetota bacterium]